MSSQPTTPSGSRVFVGREAELKALEATLLPAKGATVGNRICVISGMAGVGKSHLVEQFMQKWQSSLPTCIKLTPPEADVILEMDEEESDPRPIPRRLVHLENVDNNICADSAVRFIRHFSYKMVIITGRFRNLGKAAGWTVIDLEVPDEDVALRQLAKEVLVDISTKELQTLMRELGNLPLALHLAAGYLNAGYSVNDFLQRLRKAQLGLKPRDPSDPLLAEYTDRATVSKSIGLSLEDLEKSFGSTTAAQPWMTGFAKLGTAPAAGFDSRLGAEISGLSEADFNDLMHNAAQISLVERGRNGQGAAGGWRIHPLIAEVLRTVAPSENTFRATDISKLQEEILRVRSRAPRLKSLSVRDFKSITSLHLDLSHKSELAGDWSCIAGINGAGKSAVLQAIALVLLGDRLSLVVGDKWLIRARRRVADKQEDAEIRAVVQIGEETLELILPIGAGRIDLEKAIPDAEQRKKIKAFWDERERYHLLLSYGAGRNLSEYVDSRHATKSDEVRRQMTLFDPLTQVASVEVLLKQAPEHALILTLLKRLLSVALEDTALNVAPNHETLRFLIDGALVEASELPDGFRATIAWLADLCAAWCAKAPHEAASGDPSQIRAIVLIDEIDLHLHPSLQRVLVPRLRKALPEVQWIVTTHSPLVLSSFDKSELVLLDVNAPGGIRQLDRQILGFTMDEVYEWLMGTEPQSAALDDLEGDPRNAEARLARILAQSPTVSEEKAQDNEEWRNQLVETMRRKDAESGRP
jgi:AAA domain, putative AbiEii toxin, Type IV TA system/AAA ATPase domain